MRYRQTVIEVFMSRQVSNVDILSTKLESCLQGSQGFMIGVGCTIATNSLLLSKLDF